MKAAAPKSVRWLWTALSVLLIVGLAAYIYFVLTGSYDALVALFNIPGSTFFILVTATEVYYAYRARGLFEPAEPMRATWTLILLSACCRLSGAAFTQTLTAGISWNLLVTVKILQPERPQLLHSIGVVLSGPVAMALLAAGLMRVIVLKRRLGLLSRLKPLDRCFIAAILLFTGRQLMDIAGVLFGDHARLTVIQVILWFSDPLLALLLIEAVSIRRSVLNMGQGLVARCWGMMALGVAFTSAGDVILWAENWGYIPVVISPLGWFIWFFAVTAFASAPCYQVEAAREAHEGSYAARRMRG